MDPVTMAFYGIICGGLAAAAPSLHRTWARVLAGVLVGVVAAALLPFLRGATGL